MASQDEQYDVAVIGGGPVGLACAWRAAQRGLRVAVLDGDHAGAWGVAAGMLAPVAEAEFGERALLELGLRSAERYPAFAAELGGTWLYERGTLLVARDADEAAALERELAFRERIGLAVERLRPSAARRREPALAPTVRLALDIPGDHAADPRALVPALRRAAQQAGARLVDANATAVATAGDRVTGALAAGGIVHAGQVVIAAGVHAARLGGLPGDACVPLRPVKGQTVRLRDPRGPGLVERTIRGEGVYLVPRGDGRYVLGATSEERGWDTAATAGGVYELLRDASELVPGVLELEVDELAVGLRPATPDNLPAIGRGALSGLVWATGHYRNGILLTPVTADLVADVLTGHELPDWAAPADPARFARVPAEVAP